jgi:DNA polymerase
VYIANILKYRPPKNRDPNKAEIIEHTPYLIKQISAINPKVLVPLGNYATKFVLAGFKPEGMSKIQGISELHGKPRNIKINKKLFSVIPMYHPAAMMYKPSLIPEVEKDYVKMKKFLNS